jgi:hypothetical protein
MPTDVMHKIKVVSVTCLNASCEVGKKFAERSDVKEKICRCVNDLYQKFIMQGITKLDSSLIHPDPSDVYSNHKGCDAEENIQVDAPDCCRLV